MRGAICSGEVDLVWLIVKRTRTRTRTMEAAEDDPSDRDRVGWATGAGFPPS